MITEVFDGYKISTFFLGSLSDLGKQFPCGSFFTAGDIHYIFGIDHYAIWDRLLHNPARSERLRCCELFSF